MSSIKKKTQAKPTKKGKPTKSKKGACQSVSPLDRALYIEWKHRSHTPPHKVEIRCLQVFAPADLRDEHKKHAKLSKITLEYERKHDTLLAQGKKIGDIELDEVEEILEALLNELLLIQINIDTSCENKKSKKECEAGGSASNKTHDHTTNRKCRWLEPSMWNLYQRYYQGKGICVSSARADIYEDKYMEGAEQLEQLSKRLKELQSKPKLTVSERSTKRYLEHLQRQLEKEVTKEQSKWHKLASRLALLDYVRKQVEEQGRKEWTTLMQVLSKEVARLQANQSKVQWSIVTVFSTFFLSILVYTYAAQIAIFGAALVAKNVDWKSFLASTEKRVKASMMSTQGILAIIWKKLNTCVVAAGLAAGLTALLLITGGGGASLMGLVGGYTFSATFRAFISLGQCLMGSEDQKSTTPAPVSKSKKKVHFQDDHEEEESSYVAPELTKRTPPQAKKKSGSRTRSQTRKRESEEEEDQLQGYLAPRA